MYLETMKEVMSGMDKVLIDNSKGGSGVVPYLPLPELQKRSGGGPTTNNTTLGISNVILPIRPYPRCGGLGRLSSA